MTPDEPQEVDALCPNCGSGFKAYLERIMPEEKSRTSREEHLVQCPHCGCNECPVR